MPFIETSKIKVIPCASANDGTAPKPAIEYDPRQKVNVGLTVPVDVSFVKENPEPSPGFLKNNIITEALVSSVTTLDNSNCLPCAVDYKSKGKTRSDMKSVMFNQCRLLQIGQSCLGIAKSYKHVIQESCLEDFCVSSCSECCNIKDVCEECDGKGQISHIHSLRACQRCTENGLQYIRRAIMVLTTDC